MFSQKGQAGNMHISGMNLFKFIDFDDVVEAAALEEELEGRILKTPATVPRHNYVLHLVTNLQQRLEKNMVLVVMGDQHEINRIGQIKVGVTRNPILIGVAQHRIEQHADSLRFYQDAGMAEVSPADARPGVARVSGWRLRGKERSQQSILRVLNREHLFDFMPRPWRRFEPEQIIDQRALEGQAQMQAVVRFEPRGAQHEGAVITGNGGEHHALLRAMVITAAIQ